MNNQKTLATSLLLHLFVGAAAFAGSLEIVTEPTTLKNENLKPGDGVMIFSGSGKADKPVVSVNSGGDLSANGGMDTGSNNTVIFGESEAGSVSIVNGSFKDNSVSAEGQASIAGGMVSTQADLSVSNSEFKNNSQSSEWGPNGVLTASGGAKLTVSGSKFENNTSTAEAAPNSGTGSSGSAVKVQGGASFDISNSTFSGNAAVTKGTSTEVSVGGGTSPANSQGGALYFGGSSEKNSIKDSDFTNNSATGNGVQGGAVALFGGTTEIEGGSFSGNKAVSTDSSESALGGAIYAYNNAWNGNNPPSEVTLNVSGTEFKNNSAEGANASGGALQLSGGTTTLTDASFTGNSVSATKGGKGGAISASGNAYVGINATKDAVFSGNSVSVNGKLSDADGGFMYLKGNAAADFGVSEGATLTIGDGTAGMDSIASDSGASLSKKGEGTLTVNSSMRDFKGQLNVTGGVMNANGGLGANDVNVGSGATLNSDGGEWKGVKNSASWEKTEYFVEPIAEVAEGGTLSLANAKFQDNSFTHDGAQASGTWVKGAIYSNGTLNMKDSEMVGTSSAVNPGEKPWVNNQPPNVQGSAIHFNGANAAGNFENVKFADNSATGMSVQGGTIVAWGGKYKFDKAVFENNGAFALEGSESSVSGGALYLTDNWSSGTINADIANSAFTGNRAEGNIANAGAIIYESYAEGSSLTVSDTSFEGNKAVGETRAEGGAMRIFTTSSEEKTVLNDVTFTGNSVEVAAPADMTRNGGGAIYANASDIEFNVSKDAAFTGNYVSAGGKKDDSLGGFMRLSSYKGEGSSATFNVADGAKLSIGDGTAGEDSIASSDNSSTINKTGAGELVVNSSMAHYKGGLNVSEGSAVINNTLGSERLAVESGASAYVKSLEVSVDGQRDNMRVARADGEGSSLEIGSVSVNVAGEVDSPVANPGYVKESLRVLDADNGAAASAGSLSVNVSGEGAKLDGKILTASANGGGKVSVEGDVNVTVSDGAEASAIYAGGYSYGTSEFKGAINTNVDGASTTSIVAAGGAQGNAGTAVSVSYNDANVNLSNGASTGSIYGSWTSMAEGVQNGGYKEDTSVSHSGSSVSVSASESSVSGDILAGGYAEYKDASTSVGKTSVSLENSSVSGSIYGGVVAYEGAQGTVGSVEISVNGGSTGDIYAGGYADSKSSSKVSGDASVSLSGGASVGALDGSNVDGVSSLSVSGSASASGAVSGFDKMTVEKDSAFSHASSQKSVISGSLEVLDGGEFARSGSGMTVVDGGSLNIRGGGSYINGSADGASGQMFLKDGGSVNIDKGAVWENNATLAAGGIGGRGEINVSGTLENNHYVAAGDGSVINFKSGSVYNGNTSGIAWASGKQSALDLGANGGTINVEEGATVNLAKGSSINAGYAAKIDTYYGDVNTSGTVNVSDGAYIHVGGNSESQKSSFNINGGVLTNDSSSGVNEHLIGGEAKQMAGVNVTSHGSLNVNGGRFDNNGSVAVSDGGVISVSGGEFNHRGSLASTGSLILSSGVVNVYGTMQGGSLEKSGGELNVFVGSGNAGKTIFSGVAMSGMDSLDVGFDVKKNVSDILGTTTKVFDQAAGNPQVNVLGDGSYTFSDGGLEYALGYSTEDSGNSIRVSNSLAISDESGAAAEIRKAGSSSILAVKSGDLRFGDGVEQSVSKVETATGASLVLTEGSSLSADKIGNTNNNIHVFGGALSTNSDVSLVDVSESGVKATSGYLSASSVIIGDSMNVAVDSGKTLEISSGNISIGKNVVMGGENSSLALQGTVNIASGASLSLSGSISGSAGFEGAGAGRSSVVINGVYNPGNSPAYVVHRNVDIQIGTIDNPGKLVMEVTGNGGVAGVDFDQIAFDNASLDLWNATLEIAVSGMNSWGIPTEVGSTYNMTVNLFDIIGEGVTYEDVISGLSDMTIVCAEDPAMNGQKWEVSFTNGVDSAMDQIMKSGAVDLTVSSAVPEPAEIAALFGMLAILLAVRRSRARRA